MLRFAKISSIALLVVACGGSSNKSSSADDEHHEHEQEHEHEHGHENGEHKEHHEGGHGHHHAASLIPEVDAFHEVMAPLWHEKAKDKDWDAVCAASKELEIRAEAIQSSKSIDRLGDKQQAFKDAAAGLRTVAESLTATCAQKGKVEPSLGAVHDEFHKVMDLARER